MSKRLILMSSILWAWFAFQVGATAKEAADVPSSEEVIARALEAVGGAEAWQALGHFTAKGEYSTFSSSHPFQLWRQRPNLYRFDHWQADRRVLVGFDGESPWWENEWIPFAEVPWPTAPSRVYGRGIQSDSEFLYPYLLETTTVEVVGLSEILDDPTLELRLTLGSGLEETWHLDAESYLPVVRQSRAGYATNFDHEQWTYFSDFRPVAGVLFPYYREIELGNQFGQMTIEEVTVDGEMDGELFRFPVEPAMARLHSMVGKWRVVTTSRPLPSLPMGPPEEAVAEITAHHQGRVLEEEISYFFCDRPRYVKKTFTYDRFRNVLSVVHVDNLTTHPILLVGNPESDPLELSNVSTGTEWGMAGMMFFNRYVLRDLEKDSFVVDWDASFDGGATWATLAHFEYHRLTGN